MVVLVEKIISRSLRFPSRLENPTPEADLSASLRAFRSEVSSHLSHFLSNSSELLSLERVHKALELLPLINKAFESLIASLDHPISKWEAATADEYLNYTFNLLELLNSISYCLSNLSQDRMVLSHALKRLIKENSASSVSSASPEAASLGRVRPKDPGKHFKVDDHEKPERQCSGKEWVVHRSLLILKSTAVWVFGIVLSGLCSDVKPYTQMRKLARRFDDSLLRNADAGFCKEIMEKNGELKEVRDVNRAADRVVAAVGRTDGTDIAAEELKRRLEILEKLLHGIQKESDNLFIETLSDRNKLLDGFRSSRSMSRKC